MKKKRLMSLRMGGIEMSEKTVVELFNEAEAAYRNRMFEDAADLYRKAADQGYVVAQYSLGYSYAKGRGVTQSYLEAEK